MMKAEHEVLVTKARQIARRSNGRAKDRTGAVAFTDDGQQYVGASFVLPNGTELAVCAEQIALGAARAATSARIEVLAIWIPESAVNHPCGRCLQICLELAPEATILLQRGDESTREFSIQELMPAAFTDFTQ